MQWFLVLVGLVVVLFLTAFVCKYVSKINSLPGPGHGTGRRMFRELKEDAWIKFATQYGKTFDYEGMVATCDPAVAYRVLNTPAHTQTRSALYRLFNALVPGAGGPLLQDGDNWRRHTQVLAPVMRAGVARDAATLMHSLTSDFLDQWLGPDAGSGRTSQRSVSYRGRAGKARAARARRIARNSSHGSLSSLLTAGTTSAIASSNHTSRSPSPSAGNGAHGATTTTTTTAPSSGSSSSSTATTTTASTTASAAVHGEARHGSLQLDSLAGGLVAAAGSQHATSTSPPVDGDSSSVAGVDQSTSNGSVAVPVCIGGEATRTPPKSAPLSTCTTTGAGAGAGAGGGSGGSGSSSGLSRGDEETGSVGVGAGCGASSSGTGHVEDLLGQMRLLYARFLLRWGFGLDPDQPDARALIEEMVHWAHMTYDNMFEQGYMLMPINYVRVCLSAQRLRAIVARMLQSKAYKHSGAENFVSAMVRAEWSAKEIADEMNSLYSTHTVGAYVATCALFDLSKNEQWVTVLRQEARATFLRAGRRHPTKEDLRHMGNTMNVMRETLRMHVVSMGVVRRTGEQLTMAGQTFPAGTEIMILLHALHHHPDHFARPGTFDPNRWRPAAPPHAPHAYVPFLEGPRRCAGQQIAELQFAVVLHTLLARSSWDIALDRVPLKDSMFATMDGNIPCTFSARHR